ncbi:MAG: GNAT family N-acetyltransferase [Micromonosporaceae bacterium]|nr:GNAT family N-acetyltransferase [Micromonosporaceae bacterium]
MTEPAAAVGTGTATVRAMRDADAAQVLAIYQAGIETGVATFETRAPDWAGFTASKLPGHRLVAIDPETGAVWGWATLSPVSERCVYEGVAENAVYVHPDARGRGVGELLLRALVGSAERAGIWTVQSGIFPENVASLALHERVGFRVVGRRERLGRHHGRWRDVLLVERRSPVVG